MAGKRQVKVTVRRTAVDFAKVIRDLVDRWYPKAEKIVLVMDNLNTHRLASLYEACEPAEARRLVEYCRNRIGDSEPSMFKPAHRQCCNTD